MDSEADKKLIMLSSDAYNQFSDKKVGDFFVDSNEIYIVEHLDEIDPVFLKTPIDLMPYRFYKTYRHLFRNVIDSKNRMTFIDYYTYSDFLILKPHDCNSVNKEILKILTENSAVKLVLQELCGKVKSYYYIEVNISKEHHYETIVSNSLDFKNDDLFLTGIQQLLNSNNPNQINKEDIKENIVEYLETFQLLNY